MNILNFPTNHPYVSGLSSLIAFFFGTFVFSKNPKNRINRVFFIWNLCAGLWFLGNAFSMFYYNNFKLALLWWRIAYTSIPLFSAMFYHLYLALTNNPRNKFLYLTYSISFVEMIYLWLDKNITKGLYFLPNVGGVWNEVSSFTYFLTFGMIKLIILASVCSISFFLKYKKETNELKRRHWRFYSILFFILIFAFVEWLPSYNIRLHIGWFTVPPYTAIFAYSLIRYRLFEIDTVFHQAILYLASLVLLVLPLSLALSLNLENLLALPFLLKVGLFTFALFVFLIYYQQLKPKIGHFFRRRKLDYQKALLELPSQIGTELELNLLVEKLFRALKELLYSQNCLFLVKFPEKEDFTEVSNFGYERLKEKGILKIKPADLNSHSGLIAYLKQNLEVLEKEQIQVDPKYQDLKPEAEGFFNTQALELLVPIVLKEEILGLLGLGKKENLQLYSLKDTKLLQQLGQGLGITLDNALHHKDILEKQRLTEELRLGRDIQMALLPKETPEIEGLKIAGLMEPAKEIGGDYYDYLPKAKDRLAVVIADVSGKGVGAGLLMAVAKTAIYTISSHTKDPKDILISANDILYQHMQGEKFMTLLYLEYSNPERKITYSSAGHEHILHYQSQHNRCIPIKSGGFMLGILPEVADMLEQRELLLNPGDKLVLYTDGVTEAENQEKERFTLSRLIKNIEKHSQKTAKELIDSLYQEVKTFMGTYPQYDDITLITMEVV